MTPRLPCAVVEIRCRNGHVRRRQMSWADLRIYMSRPRCPTCRCAVVVQALGTAARPTEWADVAPRSWAPQGPPAAASPSPAVQAPARRGRPRKGQERNARGAR